MATTSDFAGGDQRYLRTVQYADSTRLSQRARLHIRYTTATVPWFPWLAGQIDWRPGAAVLEVGCGPGWLWQEAAPAVPPDISLTVTDLSAGMVGDAARRAGAAGFRVRPCVADAQAVPFAAGRFDVVIAAHMLYHVPDPGRAVADLARVVRPDGTVLVTTNGRAHLRELDDLRAEVFGDATRNITAETFGVETGGPVLREAFASVTWRRYPDELVCTEPDDVVAFLTSMPPGDSADPDQQAHLRAATARRFAAGGGVLRITKETGTFVCRPPP